MITYSNYRPVAYIDEKLVPVPGWGMHPVLAGSAVIAIDEPVDPRCLVLPAPFAGFGGPDRAVYAPARLVTHRMMPRYTAQIRAERPYLEIPATPYGGLGMDIAVGTPLGTQHITVPVEQMAKTAVDAAWPDLQQRIEAESAKILNQAQPRLRTEIDRGLTQAKKTGYLIGTAIIVSVFAAALWVKKGK